MMLWCDGHDDRRGDGHDEGHGMGWTGMGVHARQQRWQYQEYKQQHMEDDHTQQHM